MRHVKPVDLAVLPTRHRFPRRHRNVPIGPRVIYTFAMAVVGLDRAGAPRRARWWIKISEIPPVKSRCGIEAVTVHAGFAGFGDIGNLDALRFQKITEVNVVMAVTAVGLRSGRGWRECFVQPG